MKKLAGFLVTGMFALGFGIPAHADSPTEFVRVFCSKDLNMFSMQNFLFWNVCYNNGEPYSSCIQSVNDLEKRGLYDITRLHNGEAKLPTCDLGFGEIVTITMDEYHEPEETGIDEGNEWANFVIKVNDSQVAELNTHEFMRVGNENYLSIQSWFSPHGGSQIEDQTNVDVNLCTLPGRNSISLPDSVTCSYKRLTNNKILSTFTQEKTLNYLPEESEQKE